MTLLIDLELYLLFTIEILIGLSALLSKVNGGSEVLRADRVL